MAGETDTVNMEGVSGAVLEKFRRIVRSYIHRHHYQSALFWADKLVTMSGCDPVDVYWLAQALFLTKQYHRAAHMVTSRKLHLEHLGCCYVAAKALHTAGEDEEALNILDEAEPACRKAEQSVNMSSVAAVDDETSPDDNNVCSLLVLKGHILEALDNRPAASDAFQAALRQDVFCYEAFEALVQHQMLSAEEEADLLSSLPYHQQGDPQLAKFLYRTSVKKYDCPTEVEIPAELECLQGNPDLQVCIAERHYYNCDYHECHSITTGVLKADPYHARCLPTHIACLVELKKSTTLFHLAHRLVDLYPEWAVSWFAVGCYYYLTGRHDPARRYLSKATQLDRVFGPAWLAYGHSFAVENEHDQAMAAYFKACQLMKGCHLPLLYIGLEYGLTNNPNLAERFFSQALEIAPNDPFVLHELGVTAFHNQDLNGAEKYFSDALLRVQAIGKKNMSSGLSDKWESLLNNLGHTMRKLGRFSEALAFHQQALVLSPLNPSTYSAIGYVQTLTNDLTSAVESFHKALGIRREDTFSTNMLNAVIESLMDDVAPFPGYPDETPRFDPIRGQSSSLILDTSHDLIGTTNDTLSSSDLTATPVDVLSPRVDPPTPNDSQRTLADASQLSIDCEMEDASKSGAELDMDQTS